jgi:hypothetical protein
MSDPTPSASPDPSATPAASPVFTEDQLKHALHAFKKRLKLTKLDQESKLGAARPMTAGKKVENLSIQPPSGHPREIWRELAKQGKIKDSGGGFYTLG